RDSQAMADIQEANRPRKSICFFFQAEDGIRDGHVTGVQTCALPIYSQGCVIVELVEHLLLPLGVAKRLPCPSLPMSDDLICEFRSEERRVGKECRSRWSRYQ